MGLSFGAECAADSLTATAPCRLSPVPSGRCAPAFTRARPASSPGVAQPMKHKWNVRIFPPLGGTSVCWVS